MSKLQIGKMLQLIYNVILLKQFRMYGSLFL